MIQRSPRASRVFAAALSTLALGALPSFVSSNQLPRGIRSSSSVPVRPKVACPCYGVLYTFGAAPGSSLPQAPLTLLDGVLYGTTTNGGTHDVGTVFSLTPGGVQSVLFNFAAGKDGYYPRGLVAVNGRLYGTAALGGSGTNGPGTAFGIEPNGTEYTLHTFGNGTDGYVPNGGLLEVDGLLYGTTPQGGTNRAGTVFSLSMSGVETVLYNFAPIGSSDGAFPNPNLTYMDGQFYGSTSFGGTHGKGVVFRVGRAGDEKVLHSFGAGLDGGQPASGLVALNGVLYGTTYAGGMYGGGSIFAMSPTGVTRVLYNFGAPGTQGVRPSPGGLVAANGVLYGTTFGGTVRRTVYEGTIFSITPNGIENDLYAFSGGTGGYNPVGGLLALNGALYGTTESGGAGFGTIFSLTL